MVVWAVKPQTFADAAKPVRAFAGDALHLSVAAGIPSASIARWLGTERVVRAMPNTPALVGQGMTGLFARGGADSADQALVAQLLAPTGELLWVDTEAALDAVTAMSGSGPAYVFYFIEAMTEAGVEMGLAARAGAALGDRHLHRRVGAREKRDRAAVGAARTRDLQRRHDLRRDHLNATGRYQSAVQDRHPRCAETRSRTRRRIRQGLIDQRSA